MVRVRHRASRSSSCSTAFAAWRRSPWVGALAAATGTLLVTDAWFDIVLESHADELRKSIYPRGLRRAAAGRALLLDRLPDGALPRAARRAQALHLTAAGEARPSVTSSAYSRSPPTGSPLASRVTRTRPRSRSARKPAVASPVMFGFIASTTSCTPFASTRRKQLVDAQVARLDAVERRERAAEHVVEAAELRRPLERDDVDRLLDDADQRVVAPRVGADAAELLLGEVAALAAEAHALLHLLRARRRARAPLPSAAAGCGTRAAGPCASRSRGAASAARRGSRRRG